jgi:ankyrin repeat protein
MAAADHGTVSMLKKLVEEYDPLLHTVHPDGGGDGEGKETGKETGEQPGKQPGKTGKDLINMATPAGVTPLMVACSRRDPSRLDVVSYLLTHGADIHARSDRIVFADSTDAVSSSSSSLSSINSPSSLPVEAIHHLLRLPGGSAVRCAGGDIALLDILVRHGGGGGGREGGGRGGKREGEGEGEGKGEGAEGAEGAEGISAPSSSILKDERVLVHGMPELLEHARWSLFTSHGSDSVSCKGDLGHAIYGGVGVDGGSDGDGDGDGDGGGNGSEGGEGSEGGNGGGGEVEEAMEAMVVKRVPFNRALSAAVEGGIDRIITMGGGATECDVETGHSALHVAAACDTPLLVWSTEVCCAAVRHLAGRGGGGKGAGGGGRMGGGKGGGKRGEGGTEQEKDTEKAGGGRSGSGGGSGRGPGSGRGSINVNHRNRKGQTALHLCRTPEMVRLLITLGADVEAVDSEGDTPLMAACRRLSRVSPEATRGVGQLGLGGGRWYGGVGVMGGAGATGTVGMLGPNGIIRPGTRWQMWTHHVVDVVRTLVRCGADPGAHTLYHIQCSDSYVYTGEMKSYTH